LISCIINCIPRV